MAALGWRSAPVPMAAFEWRSAPASSIHVPLATGTIYVLIVIFLQRMMRGRPGLNLRLVQACHNLALSVFSLSLAIGTAIEVARRSSREGSFWLLCEDQSTQVSISSCVHRTKATAGRLIRVCVPVAAQRHALVHELCVLSLQVLGIA